MWVAALFAGDAAHEHHDRFPPPPSPRRARRAAAGSAWRSPSSPARSCSSRPSACSSSPTTTWRARRCSGRSACTTSTPGPGTRAGPSGSSGGLPRPNGLAARRVAVGQDPAPRPRRLLRPSARVRPGRHRHRPGARSSGRPWRASGAGRAASASVNARYSSTVPMREELRPRALQRVDLLVAQHPAPRRSAIPRARPARRACRRTGREANWHQAPSFRGAQQVSRAQVRLRRRGRRRVRCHARKRHSSPASVAASNRSNPVQVAGRASISAASAAIVYETPRGESTSASSSALPLSGRASSILARGPVTVG